MTKLPLTSTARHSERFHSWTTERTLTRRGVLWLGLKCDVRCQFCYDANLAHGDKVWIDVADAKAALSRFRNHYGNEFVDFMGGEPTLHPRIYEIVEHSAQIGLSPTCISHGMHLASKDRVQRFKDAGIHDFLLSIHGIGDCVDAIHTVGKGNFQKQLDALENLRAASIPIRFNVTMIQENREQLPDIAALCADYGGTVINFLTFNPYFEWSNRVDLPFQAQHSSIAPYLMKAIEVCESRGIEANVRYMPLCQLPGYERHVYNGFQLPYDPNEWDYNSWYDRDAPVPADRAWYREAADLQRTRHGYTQPAPCEDCSLRLICDGFHSQYVARWGFSEAKPTAGPLISDPAHFINNQRKVSYRSHLANKVPPAHQSSPVPLTQFNEEVAHRAGVRPPSAPPAC
jgi:MoaA/NifB/PqqE/SkfB family radical SAM enzyme